MSRVRLTHRGRQAVDDSIPYPGNVNQPDRTDRKWDEYHTFEQQTNHELPDMRHEWKDDDRDEIGYGIPEEWGMKPNVPGGSNAPTKASTRMAANKAVRIAVLLLGDKVSDDVIEAQARDMMALSSEQMDRTLVRFAETQSFYAEDEEKEEEKTAAEAETTSDAIIDKKIDSGFEPETKPGAEVAPENKNASEEQAEAAQVDADKDKTAADEKEEVAPEKDEKAEMTAAITAAVAAALKAALPDFIKEKQEEAEKKAADESKEESKEDEKTAADESEEESKEASDESKEDEKTAADDEKEEVVAKKSATDMDIELTSQMDDEMVSDPEADALLASLFEDNSATAAEELDKKVEASKKAGIKKLGSQPRVASTSGVGVTDISNIWETAPDVSEVFN